MKNSVVLQNVYQDISSLNTSYGKQFYNVLDELGFSEEQDNTALMKQEVTKEQLFPIFKLLEQKMKGDFQYCRFTDIERKYCPEIDLYQNKDKTSLLHIVESYEILQIKDNIPNVRDLRFWKYDYANEHGGVKSTNYECVYKDKMSLTHNEEVYKDWILQQPTKDCYYTDDVWHYKGKKLNDKELFEIFLKDRSNDKDIICEGIFSTFNQEKPIDFKGHSLSVSDVIVLNYDNGEHYAMYCDDFGFKELDDFEFDKVEDMIQGNQLKKDTYEREER